MIRCDNCGWENSEASGQMGHVLRGGGWQGNFECSIYHRFPTGLRDLDRENWGFRLAMDM